MRAATSGQNISVDYFTDVGLIQNPRSKYLLHLGKFGSRSKLCDLGPVSVDTLRALHVYAHVFESGVLVLLNIEIRSQLPKSKSGFRFQMPPSGPKGKASRIVWDFSLSP